jgi:hypothetical protein
MLVDGKGIPVEEIVVLEGNYSYKLDFNLMHNIPHNIPVVGLTELPSVRGKWLLINDKNLPQL